MAPANNTLFAETVLANKTPFDITVPPNKTPFDRTVAANELKLSGQPKSMDPRI